VDAVGSGLLRCADEGAHDPTARRRGARGVRFGAGDLRQVGGVVDARHLHLDVGETGLGEVATVFLLRQGAGDAPDPCLDAAADLGGQLALDDDFRYRRYPIKVDSSTG
jgi:hypothetical protein